MQFALSMQKKTMSNNWATELLFLTATKPKIIFHCMKLLLIADFIQLVSILRSITFLMKEKIFLLNGMMLLPNNMQINPFITVNSNVR